jgi:hypothetical protein
MPLKRKQRPVDWGQVIGAIIFIALFVGLILLGIYVKDDGQFDSSFFEDIGEAMKGQY